MISGTEHCMVVMLRFRYPCTLRSLLKCVRPIPRVQGVREVFIEHLLKAAAVGIHLSGYTPQYEQVASAIDTMYIEGNIVSMPQCALRRETIHLSTWLSYSTSPLWVHPLSISIALQCIVNTNSVQ